MATPIPSGKTFIHVTNDKRDLHKNFSAQYPILGDAKLVLRQFIEATRSARWQTSRWFVASEIPQVREEWLKEWMRSSASVGVPLNPYRVMWDFMHTVDPKDAIVTHDSGSPRDRLMPFYRATAPRGLSGLGQVACAGDGASSRGGTNSRHPTVLVNFMGDAAFGMTASISRPPSTASPSPLSC